MNGSKVKNILPHLPYFHTEIRKISQKKIKWYQNQFKMVLGGINIPLMVKSIVKPPNLTKNDYTCV